MRIAIPSRSGRLDAHFGKARTFEILEVHDATRSIQGRRTVPLAEADGCCAAVAMLQREKVDVVLCGGVGGGARGHLDRAGFKVVAGVPIGEVGTLVERFLAGNLDAAGGSCHDFHGRQHDGEHCHCGKEET